MAAPMLTIRALADEVEGTVLFIKMGVAVDISRQLVTWA